MGAEEPWKGDTGGLVGAGDLVIEGVELLGIELLAHLEEHVGVLLLEVAAGVGDAVDGGEDLALILEIGVGEAGEVDLFVLQVGVGVVRAGRLASKILSMRCC